MTDDEVELVAAELAKAGGVSWHPGRERGPLKLVAERYRDRARVAIAALDRFRAGKQAMPVLDATADPWPPRANDSSGFVTHGALQVGSTVVYRPPGDKRAYRCRVEQVEGTRVYLVPDLKECTGWIDVENIPSLSS